jgi:hypothetical protein
MQPIQDQRFPLFLRSNSGTTTTTIIIIIKIITKEEEEEEEEEEENKYKKSMIKNCKLPTCDDLKGC